MTSLGAAIVCSALILDFCSVSSVQLHAGTGNIRGRVVSSHGAPMTGASAYLLPSKQRVDISEDGIYAIEGVEEGTYQIAVVHPGYHFYISSPIKVQGVGKSGVVLVMRNSSERNTDEYEGAHSELEKVLRQCSVKKLAEQSKTVAKKEDVKPVESVAAADKNQGIYTEPVQGAVSASNSEVIRVVPIAATSPNAEERTNEADAGRNTDELVTEVSVIPNPVTDNATVSFALGKEGSVLLEIFSIASGERILIKDLGKRQTGINTAELNLSNLPHGSYSALIRASTCQYALTTFVKE